ncbi:tRNA (adenosine(37)-N6)-dimethylallyltransferase MiaA [Emticicia fluvialis]|uniref:tRNA (adenosine(37)-N6)-dimethylallyltransferase MiaA n=1 Tax=Emticicia fluvialis TaxID=2974474 RepID=UPI002164F447|nr:tRNA (adenosine(37)-N6)-dimethylallyltransferase MiaA [Emticicia fluvialis]
MSNKPRLIVLLGPTASGKTRLAVELAVMIDGEIISADSRQVYKGMNIGTGKDYEDYTHSSGKVIPYHLIDIVEAGNDYHVARFQKDCIQAYQDITARGKVPILCGGTGMYIEAVLKSYQHTQVPVNEEWRNELDTRTYEDLLCLFRQDYQVFYPDADVSTKKRLIRAFEVAKFNSSNNAVKKDNESISDAIIFGIKIPTEIRRERITARLYSRLASGMIEEVQGLLNAGVSPEKLVFYGLEYKFITEYLLGHTAYDDMVKKLEVAIHQFAKRQMTFFRSMEKKGLAIHWLDGMDSLVNLTEEMMGLAEIKPFPMLGRPK